MPYHEKINDYFRSAFTVDNVIFGFDEGELKVLLIYRNEQPCKDFWALPGYFVREDEDLKEAARRVLYEVTGLREVYLEQVETFGHPARHASGRVITVAYYSLIKIANFSPRPAGIAREVAWHPVNAVPELAFDHQTILRTALYKLQQHLKTRPVGFELLPPAFTLTELQHLYEAVWDTALEKRNFRKKILSMNLLRDLGRWQEGVPHRPAKLYAFDEARYRSLEKEGFNFEIKAQKMR